MIPSMSLESGSGAPREAGAGAAPGSRASAAAGSAGSGGRQRWRVLDDPVAIRALAHPLRTRLLTIIGRLGRATTADCARELEISHGLASHHLRQLAKYGFVEQVAGKDHRERPWRMVATSYDWHGATATPEGAAAVDVLEQLQAEQALEAFLDWQQRRRDWPEAWREHAGIGTSGIYLTQSELTGLVKDIDALLLRYINERPIDDVASRPPDSVPVAFTLFAIPEEPA